jgi:hypothetical protein
MGKVFVVSAQARLLLFVLGVSTWSALACRPQQAAVHRQAPPDSAQAVQIAIDAIDSGFARRDRPPLKVVSYHRDSSGFVIVLLPKAMILGGGGTVWISPDGSLRKVELGQ